MKKEIRRVIAIALTISAFSTIEPSRYINFFMVKAYAEVKGAELEDISLGRGSIDFKHSKTEYTLQLDSSIDELRVKATPKEDTAEVEINGRDVTDDDYETVIDLDKGENTITIKVENGSKKKTYTITVTRGHINNDEIYLQDIKLSAGDIDFSRDVTDYNINVPADTSDISIRAIPEDTDYDVEIDKITAYEDKNYKRTVALKNGDNEITIKIEDDGSNDVDQDEVKEKTYTLHINRSDASANTSTNTSTASSGEEKQTNTTSTTAKGWISDAGQWSYIDEKGNKETGWKQVNSAWYYLDNNGIMKTGWQNINGQWYYLDSNGAMKTGWIKNPDGKWYYLYESGAMAKNTTIGAYKLDSNGAWIK